MQNDKIPYKINPVIIKNKTADYKKADYIF